MQVAIHNFPLSFDISDGRFRGAECYLDFRVFFLTFLTFFAFLAFLAGALGFAAFFATFFLAAGLALGLFLGAAAARRPAPGSERLTPFAA